jgi:glutamate racemase
LVLGCTHYPFLRDTIQRVAGEGVTLLDPAEAVARELARRLADTGSLSNPAQQGHVQFFTSGDVAQAQAVMSHLWDAPLTVRALP